jgi:hypothetical protein
MKPIVDFENHERFGELSALALIGEATPAEYDALLEHIETCRACREEYEGYLDLGTECLPMAARETSYERVLTFPILLDPRVTRVDEEIELDPVEDHRGREQRCIVRRTEPATAGIGTRSTSPGLVVRPAPLVAIAASLILAAGVAGHRIWQIASDSRSPQISKLMHHVKGLDQQIASLQADKHAQGIQLGTLQRELAKSRSANADIVMQSAQLQASLGAESSQTQSLIAQIESSQENEAAADMKLRADDTRLAEMSNELKAARDQTAANAAEKAKFEALESQVMQEEDAIDRERKLLAADKDIRDLMGARNLHIIDVVDVDGEGRTQRPYGRVFYTEGKSLIFYAFDLGKKRHGTEQAAYQVWGAHESNDQSAQNLGIFYEDDKSNHRWVLKVDDPNVLAEIDSVFVTVEPPGGSRKPTGRKMLYANLDSQINHP